MGPIDYGALAKLLTAGQVQPVASIPKKPGFQNPTEGIPEMRGGGGSPQPQGGRGGWHEVGFQDALIGKNQPPEHYGARMSYQQGWASGLNARLDKEYQK